MFDHGADAINAFFLSISLCTITGFGSSYYFPLTVICLTTGFFFATLEEYYCGRLDLPAFNGVSDGCVLIIFMGILSGIFGCGIWHMNIAFGLSLGQCVAWVLYLAAIPTIFMK